MTTQPGAPAPDAARAKMAVAVKLAVADAAAQAARAAEIRSRLADHDARILDLLKGNSDAHQDR